MSRQSKSTRPNGVNHPPYGSEVTPFNVRIPSKLVEWLDTEANNAPVPESRNQFIIRLLAAAHSCHSTARANVSGRRDVDWDRLCYSVGFMFLLHTHLATQFDIALPEGPISKESILE